MVDVTELYEEEHRRRERPAAFRITVGVVGTLLGVLVIFGMLYLMISRGLGAPNVPVREDAPAPKGALEEVHAHGETLLTTYGWVDREQGVVRIPIDRAIEKLLEERGEGR